MTAKESRIVAYAFIDWLLDWLISLDTIIQASHSSMVGWYGPHIIGYTSSTPVKSVLMAIVVGIVNWHGLCIDMHCGN